MIKKAMKIPVLLVVNPGSTSTKIAVFEGEEKRLNQSISHETEELTAFSKIADQYAFRKKVILDFLEEHRFDPSRFTAVVGRGGMLTPMESGTYVIDDEMVEYLENNPIEHASNLGALIARSIAEGLGIKAYIVDPIVVDELEEPARVTGIPEIKRQSIFHALNQKAAAREASKRLDIRYSDANLIVVHLGGGISVGAHKRGRVVDVNNALNGDGPMAPERAGTIPAWQLVELVTSGVHDNAALKKMIAGRGGLVAHCRTNDVRTVKVRLQKGDETCRLAYQAMAYQVAKEIGAMAAVLAGRLDAVVYTGGIAKDEEFLKLIQARVSFLAPSLVFPGEDEMASLAKGVQRVMSGEEDEKRWKP
jgi:butyrate kinase